MGVGVVEGLPPSVRECTRPPCNGAWETSAWSAVRNAIKLYGGGGGGGVTSFYEGMHTSTLQWGMGNFRMECGKKRNKVIWGWGGVGLGWVRGNLLPLKNAHVHPAIVHGKLPHGVR